jgi:hypothetical protein
MFVVCDETAEQAKRTRAEKEGKMKEQIEQLKSDKAAQAGSKTVSDALDTILQLQTDIASLINAIKTLKRQRVVGQEAIDPLWQSIDHYRKQIMELKEYRYQEIEKELAERPIVWCLQDETGKNYHIETEHGPMIVLYPSKQMAKKIAKDRYAVIPYEGNNNEPN